VRVFATILFCCAASLLWSWQLTATFSLEQEYDNNVFNLSEESLDMFENGQNQYRFPYDTYDDYIVSPEMELHLRNRLTDDLTLNFYLDYNPHIYAKNDVKNYQTTTLRTSVWTRHFGIFSAHYKFLTDYHISYYKSDILKRYYSADEDLYQPCEFDKDFWQIGYSKDVSKNARLRMRYRYEKSFYNDYFVEYDGETNAYGGYLEYTLPLVEPEIGYEFETVDAHGAGVEDLDDISTESDIYSLQIRLRTFPITAGYQRENKFFRSIKDFDSYHATRKDEMDSFYVRTYFSWKNMDFVCRYGFSKRNTVSKYNISDDKNYDEHQFSVKVSYEIPIIKF